MKCNNNYLLTLRDKNFECLTDEFKDKFKLISIEKINPKYTSDENDDIDTEAVITQLFDRIENSEIKELPSVAKRQIEKGNNIEDIILDVINVVEEKADRIADAYWNGDWDGGKPILETEITYYTRYENRDFMLIGALIECQNEIGFSLNIHHPNGVTRTIIPDKGGNQND